MASVASTTRGTAALSAHDQGRLGLLSTGAQVGTVLGLAVMVPIAAARTAALNTGHSAAVARNDLAIDGELQFRPGADQRPSSETRHVG